MTLQAFGGIVEVPRALNAYTITADSFATTLDAAGEKVGVVLQAPKSGDIEAIGFRVNTVTLWDDLKAGVETVDLSTGFPTGTAKGGCVPGTTSDSDADEWKWVTMGTDATVAMGDLIALVIEFDSYVDGDITISAQSQGFYDTSYPYTPYYVAFIGAAWGKGSRTPMFGIKYSGEDAIHVAGMEFVQDDDEKHLFNTGTNPNKRGNRFSIPAPMSVVGIWYGGELDFNANIVLYDSDGFSVLGTVNFDADVRLGSSFGIFFGYFTSTITLSKDTIYYLMCEPQEVSTIRLGYFSVLVAGDMNAHPFGDSCYQITIDGVVNSGNNLLADGTTTPTQRTALGLLVDKLDDGAGGAGGGLQVHPGMSGGMRG